MAERSSILILSNRYSSEFVLFFYLASFQYLEIENPSNTLQQVISSNAHSEISEQVKFNKFHDYYYFDPHLSFSYSLHSNFFQCLKRLLISFFLQLSRFPTYSFQFPIPPIHTHWSFRNLPHSISIILCTITMSLSIFCYPVIPTRSLTLSQNPFHSFNVPAHPACWHCLTFILR